jgi:hypothetical protein
VHRNGQHQTARHIEHRAIRNVKPRSSFYKKTLIPVSWAAACAIIALGMAYGPASAGNILTKLNVLPAHLSSVSDVSNRIHKADRLSGVSFEKRWRAVPTPSAVIGGDKSRREAPQAERHIEKIPFGCDSAFSRLVTKGNFSTRCIAGLETSRINT